MTVRSDVVVDWAASPRIITVLSPSTEITIQDLLDTCREFEDDIPNMVYPYLASAAGKENLGGGVKVGITITLQNAVLAFEARSGPDYIQCRVSGGNLVAIDDNGDDISPIYPTAFTQVITTASSSATLQEQTDIQYASFNGGVSVDFTSPYSGTSFPNGATRQPVNNFFDAMAIADERGFEKFYIIGTAIVTPGLDFTGKIFVGEAKSKSVVVIIDGATVTNCVFNNITVTGAINAQVSIDDCLIDSISNVSGFIENSVLHGTIKVDGNLCFLLDCWGGSTFEPTILDVNDSFAAIAICNYNGTLSIKNKSSFMELLIELNSGSVILEDTVSGGLMTIRGVGKVVDNSSPGATIDISHLVSPANITKSVLDEPIASHNISGSIGEAIANAGLTPEQAKQLLTVFINSL